MHDPCTLAFSFPPYPGGGMSLRGHPKPWSLGRALYSLSPWIGFHVWHVDPEKPTRGQRSDDSCGWFDRRPREYGDAVRYLLNDKELMHEVERSMRTRDPVTGPYGHTYPRMPLSETLAVCLMAARYLELRRWWNGQDGKSGAASSWLLKRFTRKRNVDDVAFDLALNPIDNLSTGDEPEELIRLIAGALHRRFKPWWRHPRWHVHHWRININLIRNLRRMVERCAGCGKRLGFGYCPVTTSWGGHGPNFHHECFGQACSGAKAA